MEAFSCVLRAVRRRSQRLACLTSLAETSPHEGTPSRFFSLAGSDTRLYGSLASLDAPLSSSAASSSLTARLRPSLRACSSTAAAPYSGSSSSGSCLLPSSHNTVQAHSCCNLRPLKPQTDITTSSGSSNSSANNHVSCSASALNLHANTNRGVAGVSVRTFRFASVINHDIGSLRSYSGNSHDTPAAAAAAAATSAGIQSLSPALEARLKQLRERYQQLEKVLTGESEGEGGGGGSSGSSLREAGREYSQLRPLVVSYEQLLKVRQELGDLTGLLRDPDPAVRAMAEEERLQLSSQSSRLVRRLLLALLPRDPRVTRPALLELRSGAGGNEAALFAGVLYDMYLQFVQSRGWSWQVMELTASEVGGIRHAVIAVSDPAAPAGGGGDDAGGGGSGFPGDDDDGEEYDSSGGGVYGTLAPESGVHRVQRVPVTEAMGRVHTSTASVVVLPQADELDVRLREEDLRIETMRASGAGGQHVNVTDSAVRITHLPSGLVVSAQNERSQHLNRAAALKVLRSRLFDLESQKRAREVEQQRSALLGSGERNERIRTYNYPQGRVTDHRIHLTLHDLSSVLSGGEGLQRLMGAMRAARQEEALRRLAEEGGSGSSS
ncbi:hypothetical protein Agub_g8740 [Astrephomene gubernaculifera]|uniref:Prokaryotic-type class I peptide chain release factors domain-containing protein n=1 Tax=Astrephomene gubernaculifera TaxID=47775 RepID=A0AAD3DS50_9CHLO|nr:hypothetical protein Agub_g8740 [Astrephomene gubernaculifera]